MTRSKHPRSTRKVAATIMPVTEDVIVSPLHPLPVATAAVTASATPVTPAPAAGAKRQRDEDSDEDEDGEDAFYGRRLAKNRSKGVKNFERQDIKQGKKKDGDGEGEGQTSPTRAPATISKGPGKRLKFNPEVHGAGLEARLLALQKNDPFEEMITPRKKALKDTDKTQSSFQVSEWNEAGEGVQGTSRWTHESIPRKIATPKSVKKTLLNHPLAKVKKQEPTRTQEPAPTHEIQLTSCETSGDPRDKRAHEAAANKPTAAPSSVPLALEKRLQRLMSPIRKLQPAQSRTIDSFLQNRPTATKSSRPLTKPSFKLPGDAYMKSRIAEREQRKKRMEEAEKQNEKTRKQQQPQERFKSYTGKKVTRKDQQQGSTPTVSHPPTQSSYLFSPLSLKIPITTTTTPPAIQNSNLFTPPTAPKPPAAVTTTATPIPEPSNSQRLTLDGINQQLDNGTGLQEKKKAEEAVLRVRQEAAEKGKESARLWAEQMSKKAAKNEGIS